MLKDTGKIERYLTTNKNIKVEIVFIFHRIYRNHRFVFEDKGMCSLYIFIYKATDNIQYQW